MAKQLHVKMTMDADISGAQAQLKKLNESLNQIRSKPAALFDNANLQKASQAAATLQKNLAAATDIKTGKLDLSKFSQSLDKSNLKLKDVRATLSVLGPQGEQAFLQLSKSIAQADAPMLRMNAKLRDFVTTLKNTARWQISSSILHGFMGTLQSAYGYAQDLNESLNNIRIVTNQSVDEMARFAKEANKAAQVLNTTTTAYTDAALIFYQQGLSDKQVKERTDVTIKMANVARESATEVSSYMTAIWNNFDKEGTQSLEHFGDVITALGAATAASTEEIAHGLEKFAAVADTIGLSYEYATSAIATIVDKTRQSEDVVGTALKTIFARIQGLSLGETLEDGTSLNKYSEALASVGINIIDATGNLKDMDTILDEMGAKWQLLSKDQQVALAQTVAGVRQYNQLVSLMDNYDAFKGNVDIANNSDGALQGQADIYAESWEAARDRVKAAAENIYDSLLNEDFFIAFDNGLAEALNLIAGFIDGLGGMQGVLSVIGGFITQRLAKDAPAALERIKDALSYISGNASKKASELQQQNMNELIKTDVSGDDFAYNAEVEGVTRIQKMKQNLLTIQNQLSEAERQAYEYEIQQAEAINNIIVKESERLNVIQERNQEEQNKLVNKVAENKGGKGKQFDASAFRGAEKQAQGYVNKIKEASTAIGRLNALTKKVATQSAQWKEAAKNVKDNAKATEDLKESYKKAFKELESNVDTSAQSWQNLSRAMSTGTVDEIADAFEALSEDVSAFTTASGSNIDALSQDVDDAAKNLIGMGASSSEVYNLSDSFIEAGESAAVLADQMQNANENVAQVPEHVATMSEAFTSCVGAVMSLSAAVNSITSFSEIMSDEDATIGQKMTAILGVLTTTTMAFNAVKSAAATIKAIDTTATAANATSHFVLAAAETAATIAGWPLYAIMLALVGTIGVLVGVVLAVSTAFEKMAENSPEGKLKSANEIAQRASETFNELKESYDNLKQSIEDYQDAYNAFKKLSESADGYAEALENANEKARALIEQYGLYDSWTYGEHGEIQIDKNALNDAENEAKRKKYEAALASSSANIMVTQAKKSIATGSYEDWIIASLSGQGSYTEDGYFMSDTKNSSEVLEQMASLTEEQFQTIANSIDTFNDMVVYGSEEAKTSLEGLANDIDISSEDFLYLSYVVSQMGDSAEDCYNTLVSASAQLRYQYEDLALKSAQSQGLFDGNENAQQAYANLLSQSEDYQNAVLTNADKASNISNKELKKLLNEDDYGSWGLSDKELAMAYAKYVEKWSEEDLQNAQYKKGTGKGTVTSGELTTGELDDQQMRDAIANAILSEQLASNVAGAGTSNIEDVEQIKKDITTLQSLSDNVSDVALNALSNYQQGSELKLDSSLLSPEDIEELKGVMDEIGSDFGTSLTEAVENYDPSKYFERLEAQQSANIDNQIATEGLDADVIATQTELIMENTEALEDNENAAKQLAVNNTRMNKGVETLIDNWDDWNKTLKNSDKTSEEYARTITEMRSCLGDLVGLTDNLEGSLSTSFFESAENLELMERAANADTEAIRELGNAVAQDLAKGMEIADEFVNVFDEADAKLTFGDNVYTSLDQLQVAFGTAKANVLSVIDEISQAELKLGDDLASAIGDDDMQKFVDGLNQMAIMTNMSVADMQAMLNSLGVEANVTETWVPETVNVPVYTIERKPIESSKDENGNYWSWEETSRQTGTQSMEGGRMVASIQYSEDGSESGKPQISYVGHGNISTGNQTKAADAAKKRSGGGSDKKKKSEKGKTQKEEVDRYHEIKEVLEDLGRELDRIGKKKDRAWGGGKLAAINAETQAIKNQLGALKQYHSQISANLGSDRANANSYGWSFDGNGNVSNYEGTLAGLINEYNAAVEAFNNSAQEDADQERLDKAKEHYEEAKEALAQYEETKDLYEDVLDQITEATYALADAELEAIEYSVEIKLELDDNKLKLLEDIMETIGDSAARAVDNIEMIEKSIDTVLHQMETSKDGMKEIFDYIGLSGDVANRIMNGTASEGDQKSLAEILNSYGGAIDMDRVVQDLQQYQDNLLSYNEALRNYRDQVFDTVNNAFSEHLEDFDRANDKIAHCVNLVSGYKDLIEAIGRKNIDVHGELTQKLNQALRAQAEDAHRAALAKEAYAQEAYQKALEGYQTAVETGDEYAINKWTEILETAQDELQAAKEDSQSALTEWANAIAESFSGAIQKVIDDLDSALGGLTQLRDQFDMAQEIDAQYLDDYQKIYELSKLTREVQASIDETDNVAAKKALMEYQQKITEYQRESVQMSQYELDYLRAEYDLEMAKIAMEEARNAKSQVTMTKDSEGNYSYVYTADDAAVEQAEQSYEDRLYAMQQLNGQYINELQSNILTMQEELSARLEEIANDDSLSYQDKMAKMQEVTDYYTERIQYYNEQLTICIDNNKSLYEDEWTDYHNKTGYKISANEDYVDSWDETTLAILTNVESQEEYMEMLEEAINHAKEEAINACDEAMEALDEAGMTAEELGDTISNVTDELVDDAEEAADSAEQMSEEYQNAMDEIMDAAITFTSAYAAMISSTIAQNQQLISSMQQVIQMALQMKATLASVSNSSVPGSGGPGSGGGNPGNGANATALANEAMAIVKGVHNGSIPQTSSGWQPSARSQGYSDSAISIALKAFNDSKSGAGYDYYYQKALQIAGSYDTGGYTGSWGTSEGRLALLHQKELVLNAQDTPNLLDAIGIVRDIAKAIDINALSAMVNGGFSAITIPNNQNEILEQNVHITAEFPNATNKNEILEAFDNVINLAAQYANRKN